MRKKSRKQLLRDAKRFLKSGFVKGDWVRFPKVGTWSPGQGMDELNKLIEKAKKEHANPECHVCAEGAVYLACALAGESQSEAKALIRALNARVPPRYGERGIMRMNDSRGVRRETVIKVFDEVEAAMPDD